MNYSQYSINDKGMLVMNFSCAFSNWNNKRIEEFQAEHTIIHGKVVTNWQWEIYAVNNHSLLHACNFMTCGMGSMKIGRLTIAIDN